MIMEHNLENHRKLGQGRLLLNPVYRFRKGLIASSTVVDVAVPLWMYILRAQND
jgi:hypothetical protein